MRGPFYFHAATSKARQERRRPSRRLAAASLLWLATLMACTPGLPCPAQDAKLRVPLTQTPPTYPEIARRMGVAGTVTLVISISPEGEVTRIIPEEGHPMLIDAAKRAVNTWRYVASRETTTAIVHLNFNPR